MLDAAPNCHVVGEVRLALESVLCSGQQAAYPVHDFPCCCATAACHNCLRISTRMLIARSRHSQRCVHCPRSDAAPLAGACAHRLCSPVAIHCAQSSLNVGTEGDQKGGVKREVEVKPLGITEISKRSSNRTGHPHAAISSSILNSKAAKRLHDWKVNRHTLTLTHRGVNVLTIPTAVCLHNLARSHINSRHRKIDSTFVMSRPKSLGAALCIPNLSPPPQHAEMICMRGEGRL